MSGSEVLRIAGFEKQFVELLPIRNHVVEEIAVGRFLKVDGSAVDSFGNIYVRFRDRVL
jgi:hypothetical protein